MSTIASRAKNCVDLFNRCVDLLRQPSDEHDISESQVTDALSRFKIWAGNIGATQNVGAKSSLEFRLRDAPKIAAQINGILDDLIESLEDAASIISNVRQNRKGFISTDLEEGDDEEISELREILESVDDGIRQLFRFSILLRNNTNRDRYAKAITAGASAPFDSQFDISHVAHKFPCMQISGKEWLIERLGKAISQRRQFLKYCQDHRDKTFRSPKTETAPIPAQQLLPLPVAHTERGTPSQSELSRPTSTLAQTQASTLVLIAGKMIEESNDDTQSQTSYATSVDEGNSGALLKVVPIESISNGLGHFECIYCWQIQALRSQKAWKKHVLTDLKPYVCTFEDCELKLFSDRHTWFSHELREHRREWQCHFCTHKPFQVASNYVDHLQHHHNMPIPKDQWPAILEMAQRAITQVSPTDCPFCDDWEEKLRAVNQHIPVSEKLIVSPSQFQHHMGSHFEQLALFAIPRGYIENGEADSGNAAASHYDSGALSLSDASDASPDLAEDLNRCQEVLYELSSEGNISEHFKHTPNIPSFSMWLTTGHFVKVSPLDLGTLSQKLASGEYHTASDFLIDVVLMFAMHRISRTNERDFYTDSKISDLFERGWKTPFTDMPFSQIVHKTEQKMRWLFYNTSAIKKMIKEDYHYSYYRDFTVFMADGTQWAIRLPSFYTIRDVYNSAECCELINSVDNVPTVFSPSDYTHAFFFNLISPHGILSNTSSEKIGELIGKRGEYQVYMEHLTNNKNIQVALRNDNNSVNLEENTENSTSVELSTEDSGLLKEADVEDALLPQGVYHYKASLLEAVERGDVALVTHLLSKFPQGAQLPKSWELLKTAALRGNKSVSEILLDSGYFDINAKDDEGRTALFTARSRGQDGDHSIEDLLNSRGAQPLSLEEANLAQKEYREWLMSNLPTDQMLGRNTLGRGHKRLTRVLKEIGNGARDHNASIIATRIEPYYAAAMAFVQILETLASVFPDRDAEMLSYDGLVLSLDEAITGMGKAFDTLSGTLGGQTWHELLRAVHECLFAVDVCYERMEERINSPGYKSEHEVETDSMKLDVSVNSHSTDPEKGIGQTNDSALDSHSTGQVWTMDRIVLWLTENDFSSQWKNTFLEFKIADTLFLQLPYLESEDRRKEYILNSVKRQLLENRYPTEVPEDVIEDVEVEVRGEMERMCNLISSISNGKAKMGEAILPQKDPVIPPRKIGAYKSGITSTDLDEAVDIVQKCLADIARLEAPREPTMAPLDNAIKNLRHQVEGLSSQQVEEALSTDQFSMLAEILRKCQSLAIRYRTILEHSIHRSELYPRHLVLFSETDTDTMMSLCGSLSDAMERLGSDDIKSDITFGKLSATEDQDSTSQGLDLGRQPRDVVPGNINSPAKQPNDSVVLINSTTIDSPLEYHVKETMYFAGKSLTESVLVRLDDKYVHIVTENPSKEASTSARSIELSRIHNCTTNPENPSCLEFDCYPSEARFSFTIQLDASTPEIAARIVKEINTAAVRFTAQQGLISSGEMSRLVAEHHGLDQMPDGDDVPSESKRNIILDRPRSQEEPPQVQEDNDGQPGIDLPTTDFSILEPHKDYRRKRFVGADISPTESGISSSEVITETTLLSREDNRAFTDKLKMDITKNFEVSLSMREMNDHQVMFFIKGASSNVKRAMRYVERIRVLACKECREVAMHVNSHGLSFPFYCSDHQCPGVVELDTTCDMPKLPENKDCGQHTKPNSKAKFHHVPSIYVSQMTPANDFYTALLQPLGIYPLQPNPVTYGLWQKKVDYGYHYLRDTPETEILFTLRKPSQPGNMPASPKRIMLSSPSIEAIDEFRVISSRLLISPRSNPHETFLKRSGGQVRFSTTDADGNMIEVIWTSRSDKKYPELLIDDDLLDRPRKLTADSSTAAKIDAAETDDGDDSDIGSTEFVTPSSIPGQAINSTSESKSVTVVYVCDIHIAAKTYTRLMAPLLIEPDLSIELSAGFMKYGPVSDSGVNLSHETYFTLILVPLVRNPQHMKLSVPSHTAVIDFYKESLNDPFTSGSELRTADAYVKSAVTTDTDGNLIEVIWDSRREGKRSMVLECSKKIVERKGKPNIETPSQATPTQAGSSSSHPTAHLEPESSKSKRASVLSRNHTLTERKRPPSVPENLKKPGLRGAVERGYRALFPAISSVSRKNAITTDKDVDKEPSASSKFSQGQSFVDSDDDDDQDLGLTNRYS